MAIISFPSLPEQSRLVVVGGISGIGKSSMIQSLLATYPGRYARPLSYTSRLPRSEEGNTEYVFTNAEDVLFRYKAGELVNLDSVYGNYYGMSKRSVDSIIDEGKHAIKEIHPSNHDGLRKYYPNLISILIAQSSKSRTSVRNNRAGRDEEYYKIIDTSQFDIVYHRSDSDTSDAIARTINAAILSISKTDEYFPRPPAIDRVNLEGYTAVAAEFQDGRRITTAFFHSLTIPFFSEAIVRYVSPGATCLEVGPGSGWLRRLLTWPAAMYSVSDLSPNMLSHLRRHFPGIPCIEASARAMPLPSNTFDVIVASLCDPYCYPAALCELHRLVKKGGYLLLTAPAKMWSDGIRAPQKRNKTTFVLQDSSEAEVYSFTFHMPELLSLLSMCSFRPVEHRVMMASPLNGTIEVPPDIMTSCRHSGVSLDHLETVNCVVAATVEQ